MNAIRRSHQPATVLSAGAITHRYRLRQRLFKPQGFAPVFIISAKLARDAVSELSVEAERSPVTWPRFQVHGFALPSKGGRFRRLQQARSKLAPAGRRVDREGVEPRTPATLAKQRERIGGNDALRLRNDQR